jgi:hypothetical protein
MNPMDILSDFGTGLCLNPAMTHWEIFTKENVNQVPEGILGVFQLSKGAEIVHFVGRADADLRSALSAMLEKGYRQFQWVHLPWVKETFEMHCRLFHHAGGLKKLDNLDHPYPPEGKLWVCPVSSQTPAMCEL